MNSPNPASDLFAFLTKLEWPTGVYWLLLIGCGLLAWRAWQGDPAQRTLPHLGRMAVRVVVGTCWWQQSLWKIPPNYDGLKFWMQNMVDHAPVHLQSWAVANIVLPNIAVFGPIVYAVEVAVGVSLILGVLTRWGGLLGLGMAANLWLGLYSAPGEWPWTYGFLILLQCIYVIDPPGRSLGVEALNRRDFT